LSTRNQYRSYIKRWFQFCADNNINSNNTKIKNVLSFLFELYKSGLGYSSINTARSALSLLIPSINGQTIGNDQLVNRFVKGVFKLRPPAPRYEFTWDVNCILKLFLSWPDNNDLSIKQLSIKLVALLALVTAQRVQCINSIMINNISYNNNIMIIKIDKLLKTSKPGSVQPSFEFPPYQVVKLCVAKTINDYLNMTLNCRKYDELFLSLDKPYRPISNQTISRWLKEVLKLSGIDTNLFKAHSFRGAATSKAYSEGCNIDNIFKRAGWSNNSTMFAKFYHRQINVNDDFTHAVLSQ
jgi:integrase